MMRHNSLTAPPKALATCLAPCWRSRGGQTVSGHKTLLVGTVTVCLNHRQPSLMLACGPCDGAQPPVKCRTQRMPTMQLLAMPLKSSLCDKAHGSCEQPATEQSCLQRSPAIQDQTLSAQAMR